MPSNDAKNGYALLNPARWLDRTITPSQSTMNSRAYAALETLGLVARHNFDGERKTTHLRITDAGEQLARKILNTDPANAS